MLIFMAAAMLSVALTGCGNDAVSQNGQGNAMNNTDEMSAPEINNENDNANEAVDSSAAETENKEAANAENISENANQEQTASDAEVGNGETIKVSDALQEKLSGEDLKYLSLNIGKNETQLNFAWFAKNEADAYVIMQKKSQMPFNEFYKSNMVKAKVKKSKTMDGYYTCRATVKGISPNTEYYYVVGNENAWSPVYEYKSGNFSPEWSFAIIGDPEMGISTDDESIDQIAVFDKTINNINTNIPDAAFLLSMGDQVGLADQQSHYEAFLNHAGLYSLALAPAIGNHDVGGRYFREHFNLPNFDAISGLSEEIKNEDYWFKYNNAVFMMINSNNMTDYNDYHQKFIEEVAKANTDAKWVVAVFHHPPFTSYEKYKADAAAVSELIPMLENAGVDVVLNGHDHIYTRTYMMNGTTPTGNTGNKASADSGTLYMTFSSSSSSLYHNAVQNPNAAFQYSMEVPQATQVNVSDTSFKISTYNADTWELIDEFELTK